MVEVDCTDSYGDVRLLWKELNRTYKGGDLVLDWEAHARTWTQFHQPRGSQLKILVAHDRGECVAIIPFARPPATPEFDEGWILGEDSLVAREYFCPPERLHELVPHLPPHSSTDLSCFYRPQRQEFFVPHPGCIVDLGGSAEAYFALLPKRRRHEYTRSLKINSDIQVRVDSTLREEALSHLRAGYIDYWRRKFLAAGKTPIEPAAEKLAKDFVLLRRAEELGKLIALYFYLAKQLVAANFSVRRETDRVDDYLCLRDTDPSLARRGLGIFAILENMRVCRELGIRYYDMSDFPGDYKSGFANEGSFQYWVPVLGTPDLATPGRVAEPAPGESTDDAALPCATEPAPASTTRDAALACGAEPHT
ncbi:MAG: GNAT family N-acetyltransferase [Planctomycetota bacterium]